MLIVVSMIAFIVNVGLFVKAKINLQNSVDAAAYAGAATQARQLTNIAHVNWEIRNTYKEWMFKYYVLGQMGLPNVRAAEPIQNGAAGMNFTLKQFSPPGASSIILTDANNFDRFNVPSICIHFGQFNHNICEIYDVPGLPRFPAPGLPNIQQAHEDFLDSITATKSKDCSFRSNVNFATALQWAYGTQKQVIDGATLIASDRMGAWPQALELGMRMRNLEYIVNMPPFPESVCTEPGPGCVTFDSIMTPGGDPLVSSFSERTSKAFMSAYRSLAGGVDKANRDLAINFKLTELKPEPFVAGENTVSTFLIPSNKTYPTSGEPVNTKYYLDLQAYPVNMVTFYTSFITQDSTFQSSGGGAAITVEGTCAGTKTALPVPGYLMGFVKNPEVMTYYAVKGESRYVGLFYPFTDQDGIELTAYSAAKPFGGRIGPRLFTFNDTGGGVKARDDSDNKISSAYIAGIKADVTGFTPGFPLPVDSATVPFWVSSPDDVIGGVPSNNASQAKFVVPNILYDATPGAVQGSLTEQKGANVTKILIIERRNTAADFNAGEVVGLWNPSQFKSIRANLPEGLGAAPMTAPQVNEAMEKARRPTWYEALNYMIPTFSDTPRTDQTQEAMFTLPLSDIVGTGPGNSRIYALFAPLFGENTLYDDLPSIEKVIQDYINSNGQAVKTFTDALKDAADQIRSKGSTDSSGARNYEGAADTIYDDVAGLSISASNCDAASMAAKFDHFFLKDTTVCGIDPLKKTFVEYVNKSQSDDEFPSRPYNTFYRSSFIPGAEFSNGEVGITGPGNLDVSTGFVPGPRQNGTELGGERSAIAGTELGRSLKRNSYSTKFFAVEKVLQSSSQNPYGDPMIFMERTGLQEWPDFTGIDIVNKLPDSQLQGFFGPDH